MKTLKIYGEHGSIPILYRRGCVFRGFACVWGDASIYSYRLGFWWLFFRTSSDLEF